MIPIIQKAANVCVYCRVRKQKCDRMLPRCERCSAKDLDCDYSAPPQFTGQRPEQLVIHNVPCGHADLSPHGAAELVHAVKACSNAPSLPDSATNLSDLISEILDVAGFSLSDALTFFGPCIQQWCPIFFEDHIFGCTESMLSEPVNAQDGPQNPILWMCLWLVMRKPCSPHENMGASELYSTLKQVHAVLQSVPTTDFIVLQVGLIIAIHELGHGLRMPAYQTLASCTATLRLLELEAMRKQDTESLEKVWWLKSSVIMLDRQLTVSVITDCLPLTNPTDHPISKSLRKILMTGLPPIGGRPLATSPRKLYIRTGAAVTAGHALEYIHDRQQGVEPEKSYDQVDAIVNRCISMLVVKPDSLDLFHCNAVPMTFSSHIVLQSTHIRYLQAAVSAEQPLEEEEFAKALAALKFSRSIAWDMMRVGFQMIKSEESMIKLPLSGLCSVLRAALLVLETNGLVDDNLFGEGEIDAYIQILHWFASRWTIGNEYLAKAKEVLG